ncbi:MAG: YfhO family protein [Clostridiaceae bacterium]|nr:YfhO family protein [Clostridiaceae bacterium]
MKKRSTRGFYLLAFLLPFGLMGMSFALHGIYPFGDRQILVTDFWQQYYPLYAELRRKLIAGDSLLYSWNAGLGINFIASVSYYLASPMNLALALVPERFLREGLTLLLLIKIGLAGVWAAYALRKTYGGEGVFAAFFGAMYALCAFTLGYYWNIIWFDAFALVPLVAAATVQLVRRGNVGLYLLSLALCVFTNYYIGYGVCIFVLLTFFGACIAEKLSMKLFWKRFFTITMASVLALGMSAVLTLPTILALRHTYSSFSAFPGFRLYESFLDVLGNFVSFSHPTAKEGLPNLASSVLCMAMLVPYVLCKRIPLRERIYTCALFVFIVVSCNVSVLNFVWHGLHTTNMIPYRFSYLATWTLIAMAYRVFLEREGFGGELYIGLCVGAAAFLVCAALGDQSMAAVLASMGLCALYGLTLWLLKHKAAGKPLATVVFCVLIAAELGVNAYIGVTEVQTTDRASYPKAYEDVEALLDTLPEGAYRVETAARYTYNDPLLYGYRGVGLFSSAANVSVTKFVERLGLHAWDAGNRYVYAETSPLTDVFLGIRYLVSIDGGIHDTENRAYAAESGRSALYENRFAQPMGFVANAAILSYTGDASNPFLSQNTLFRAATGLDADLYTPVDIVHVGHKGYTVYRSDYGRYRYEPDESTLGSDGKASFQWNYELPSAGVYYAYTDVDNIDYIHVLRGSESWWYEQARPYLFCMGAFKEGEIVSLYANVDTGKTGTAKVYVYRLNEDVLRRGLDLLSATPYEIDTFTSTAVTGTVSTPVDGVLYLAIPNDGGWHATVDGAEAELLTVDGAMCAIALGAGTHTVALRYVPEGFIVGAFISVACFAASAVWVTADAVRRRKEVFK